MATMRPLPKPDDLVTLRRAAELLGVGQRQIYQARDRGELSFYQFRSSWAWVRWGEARAWLERCHRRAPPRTLSNEPAHRRRNRSPSSPRSHR
jgi:hypothetical protein